MIYNYEPYRFTASTTSDMKLMSKEEFLRMRAEYEARKVEMLERKRKELLEYDRYDQSED